MMEQRVKKFDFLESTLGLHPGSKMPVPNRHDDHSSQVTVTAAAEITSLWLQANRKIKQFFRKLAARTEGSYALIYQPQHCRARMLYSH